MSRALVLFSGGLDSVVAATYAVRSYGQGNVFLLFGKYGCPAEEKEWAAMCYVQDFLHVESMSVDLSWLRTLGGSTLTGGNADDWNTTVPARNMVLLSVAAAYAERYRFDCIYTGINDEPNPPGYGMDSSSGFVDAMCVAMREGTKQKPSIMTPLRGMDKKTLILEGRKMGAPLHLSWSCYGGRVLHCGTCKPCASRRKAYAALGIADPILYSSPLP